jgi:hypothetical protein
LAQYYEPDNIEIEKEIDRLKNKKCFIATAVYGAPDANEIVLLKDFRDKILIKNIIGRIFINIYYFVSPPVANFITNKPKTKRLVKNLLIKPILSLINLFQ